MECLWVYVRVRQQKWSVARIKNRNVYSFDRPCGVRLVVPPLGFIPNQRYEIGHIIFSSYSNWTLRLICVFHDSKMQITWIHGRRYAEAVRMSFMNGASLWTHFPLFSGANCAHSRNILLIQKKSCNQRWNFHSSKKTKTSLRPCSKVLHFHSFESLLKCYILFILTNHFRLLILSMFNIFFSAETRAKAKKLTRYCHWLRNYTHKGCVNTSNARTLSEWMINESNWIFCLLFEMNASAFAFATSMANQSIILSLTKWGFFHIIFRLLVKT